MINISTCVIQSTSMLNSAEQHRTCVKQLTFEACIHVISTYYCMTMYLKIRNISYRPHTEHNSTEQHRTARDFVQLPAKFILPPSTTSTSITTHPPFTPCLLFIVTAFPCIEMQARQPINFANDHIMITTHPPLSSTQA